MSSRRTDEFSLMFQVAKTRYLILIIIISITLIILQGIRRRNRICAIAGSILRSRPIRDHMQYQEERARLLKRFPSDFLTLD